MPIALYSQGDIRYEEKGNGEPLILIHGVGLDHTMWEKYVEMLSTQFRVIVYDTLGHGGSEHPPGPYTLSQFVEQLTALMDYLHINKSHIVGFSMGGMVAQAFELTYTDRVSTLTIMNAVANRTEEQRNAVLARVEEVKKIGPIATIEPAIQRWFSHHFIVNHDEIINNIRTRLKTNNPPSYLAAYSLFATADKELWPKLHNILSPTLIITGEHDRGSNPEMAKQMNEKIRCSEVVIVPNMKHMLPVEDATNVSKLIRLFIEKQTVHSE
ncbi:alpha/beta fold hydrolase [Pseudalkalibacillus decolorationis]|uniref:alpha/beta fold hydrolase n=1 Tax=Pseudalkalibacillus decolorationis TaxID=163879 RepID=UPI0021477945|nr:alpha/beta hydrolase [Pseudalkalibacillus decolorationis]